MKKIFYILILVLFLMTLIIFTPGLQTLDRLLTSENEIKLWKENATEGNFTAISNLIMFYEDDKIEQKQWLNLFKEQRKKRKDEYIKLKNKSDDGNESATLKIEEFRSIGYF